MGKKRCWPSDQPLHKLDLQNLTIYKPKPIQSTEEAATQNTCQQKHSDMPKYTSDTRQSQIKVGLGTSGGSETERGFGVLEAGACASRWWVSEAGSGEGSGSFCNFRSSTLTALLRDDAGVISWVSTSEAWLMEAVLSSPSRSLSSPKSCCSSFACTHCHHCTPLRFHSVWAQCLNLLPSKRGASGARFPSPI
jgi:hypothetical protein